MNTQTIELEGFDIEVASELYCERGGDNGELVDIARTDRRSLGHNVDESAVLCVRCMLAPDTGRRGKTPGVCVLTMRGDPLRRYKRTNVCSLI